MVTGRAQFAHETVSEVDVKLEEHRSAVREDNL